MYKQPRIDMHFLNQSPRFMFFTGKGGVGKTSIACATAIYLAAQNKRVLLVSTDPASNVGQVFGVNIGNTITAIPAVSRLFALEIDRRPRRKSIETESLGRYVECCRILLSKALKNSCRARVRRR